MSQFAAPGGAGLVTVASALQTALAAENAAVFGYGAAGAHLTGARRAVAERAWVAHEAARDTLTEMLLARGIQPAPAASAYKMPFAVHTSAGAAALAAHLEDRVASAFMAVVALGDPRLREFGARSVRSAALRAAWWRGATLAFPGLELPAPGPGQARPGPSPGSARPASSPTPGSASPGTSQGP